MKIEEINNILVKKIPIEKPDDRSILGSDLFPEIYSNIYLSAKKKSGKSTVIYNIIQKCVDKYSSVFVFCSTFQKDLNWIAIKDYLDKKGIPNEFYGSIKSDEGVDQLKTLIDIMQTEEENENKSDEEDEPEDQILLFNEHEIRVRVKKKKPKKISQKYLIIFDDISTELKNPNISHLLKTNRHYKSKVIISSQWLLDLQPQARRQVDVYLIFSGINDEKLESLYINADLNIDFEKFKDIYREATKEKYNFLYVDSSNCKYRINFNREIIF